MPRTAPNRQYNVAAPGSFAVRIAGWQRRRMYASFVAATGVAGEDTILDVGVTSDQSYAASNYLEAWYPRKDRITAVGLDDAAFLERLYPGVRFIRADGRKLPFADRSFDVVHSSAVLEHIGGAANRRAYVGECARVARKAVFLTTPNRWFPVEFHTVLPFVHWLPKPTFRALMRRTGRAFFADERNLDLLSRRDLSDAVAAIDAFEFGISSVALAGWPSNLLLVGRRKQAV
ncbi:MAG TPA: methyltransferase domain-containing protein [Casimicrobiaceae bacterium]